MSCFARLDTARRKRNHLQSWFHVGEYRASAEEYKRLANEEESQAYNTRIESHGMVCQFIDDIDLKTVSLHCI